METISAYGAIAEELKREVRGYPLRKPALGRGARGGVRRRRAHRSKGLPNVKNGELLYVGGDKYALAMNLEEPTAWARSSLTDSYELGEGDIAYSTGKIVGVPVGDLPCWGASSIPWVPRSTAESRSTSKKYRPVEAPAPAIFDRANVNRTPAHGHQGDRQHDPRGQGAAGTDHRGQADGQDGARRGHHHQPEEARTSSASMWRSDRRLSSVNSA